MEQERMTLSQYRTQREEIQKEAARQIMILAKRFVDINSTVKVGDIVNDSSTTIRVGTISVVRAGLRGDDPSALYQGKRLTRKLVPFKTGEAGSVYACNTPMASNFK